MSIWIRVFCRETVSRATPEEMRAGIARRLELLTYLFCPEDEEEPGDVLGRLRIENCSEGDAFGVFLLHYRRDGGPPIRAERWYGPAKEEEVEERLEDLEGREGPAADRVRAMLAQARESIAFDLKLSHAQGMGWPLAVAGAAWLAEIGQGLIHAEGTGWMSPKGNEVEFILPDDEGLTP